MSADPHLVRDVFLSAASLPPEDRERYLNDRCGEDIALRAAVERLLAADEAPAAILDVGATSDSPTPPGDTAPETGAVRDGGRAHSETSDEITAGASIPGPTDPATGHDRPARAPNGFVPGQVVAGRYTLQELLGEGGMGTVYRAEQNTPVKRLVALKVIRTGVDSRKALARFDAERQALALMDHPNIARVFDGGATENRQPFFVMELVQGTPITDYCDEKRLSIPARLELFVAVCQAVQHAHQKGIIHRDLKPSNILVTEVDGRPTPKVIDFGVAKAVEFNLTDQSLGDTGAVVGTPAYMSPEQADPSSMDIDTRTDVYALGVVLYELLTGAPPLDPSQFRRGAWMEMLRMVREVDPPRPSTRVSTAEELPNIAARRNVEPARLRQALSGDLDWIVMKALEKDRSRRYETANGFAADVLRHLANEPVLAAPPGRAYRMKKFVRKHRAGAVAASLVLLALLAGMAGTTWGMVQARRARDAEASARRRAEAERHRAERSEALAQEQRKRAEDRETQAIDAVKRFRDAVADEPELKNNPALETLRKRLLKEPLAFFKALRDRLQADKDTRPESVVRLANASTELGKLIAEIGDKRDALIAHREALAIYRKLVDDRPDVDDLQDGLAKCHNEVGNLLRETGQPAEAMKACETARAIYRKLVDGRPTVNGFQYGLARARTNIGVLLEATGKPAEALKEHEAARAVLQKLADANPANTDFQKVLANTHEGIGTTLLATGRRDEAMKAYQAARAVRRKLADDHPTDNDFQHRLAGINLRIGNMLNDIGQRAEAMKAYETALAIDQRLADANPTATTFQDGLALAHGNIGHRLFEMGRRAEALKSYESVRAIFQKLADANPTVTRYQEDLALAYGNLGATLCRTGKPDEALKAAESSWAILKKLTDANPAIAPFQERLAWSYMNIGIYMYNIGKMAEARKAFEAARAIFQKLADANPTNTKFQEKLAEVHGTVVQILFEIGKPVEALKELEAARAVRQKLADAHPANTAFQNKLAIVHMQIGSMLLMTGKPDEARKEYESGGEIWRKLAETQPADSDFQKNVARSHYSIGDLWQWTGEPAEAAKEYESARGIWRKLADDQPKAVECQYGLGATLQRLATLDIDEKRFETARDRLRQAVELQRKALALAPANPIYHHFLVDAFTNLIRACRGLGDAKGAAEAERELAKLRGAVPANAALDARLAAIIQEGQKPRDRAERMALARRAYAKALYTTAARLWIEHAAMGTLPDLNRPAAGRYQAARAAAQAGCGLGKDSPPPDEAARARLRRQALEWLVAQKAEWSKYFAADTANAGPTAARALEYWRTDPDLFCVRDEQELAKLPEPERAAFRKFWADVDKLLARAKGGK